MDGVAPTWAADLLAAFRAGRLSADELWCVVLDCHRLDHPGPVVGLVLRTHAALAEVATVPAPPGLGAPPSGEAANESELFVLDEATDDLSIPA